MMLAPFRNGPTITVTVARAGGLPRFEADRAAFEPSGVEVGVAVERWGFDDGAKAVSTFV
jgi:hypothetical protein